MTLMAVLLSLVLSVAHFSLSLLYPPYVCGLYAIRQRWCCSSDVRVGMYELLTLRWSMTAIHICDIQVYNPSKNVSEMILHRRGCGFEEPVRRRGDPTVPLHATSAPARQVIRDRHPLLPAQGAGQALR